MAYKRHHFATFEFPILFSYISCNVNSPNFMDVNFHGLRTILYLEDILIHSFSKVFIQTKGSLTVTKQIHKIWYSMNNNKSTVYKSITCLVFFIVQSYIFFPFINLYPLPADIPQMRKPVLA